MQVDISLLERCTLCPRACGADRQGGQTGFCGAGRDITVAHFGPHFGEEPPITGTHGSGNVFFAHCNMRCIFCQNYRISHFGQGKTIDIEELVGIFFQLKEMKCHNINLVSPTPYIPFIASAIREAKLRDIGIPFIYNTNGYDSVASLKMLEGLIDIYLPDFKYSSATIAAKLSGASSHAPYPEYARSAIWEMKRQVGDLVIEDDLARKGLLIRHLVLPGGIAGSRRIISWIRDTIGTSTWIALMSQYLPLYRSGEYPLLRRKIKDQEYNQIVDFLLENGFENVFIQELDSASLLVPDFEKDEPFLAILSEEG
ncbi:MAG: radical SAM protein [Syntrophorhabdaceae bacterium]